MDLADVLQGVVVEVDELPRAEVERLATVGGAPGAGDVGAELTCELRQQFCAINSSSASAAYPAITRSASSMARCAVGKSSPTAKHTG
jgi:hypothetical protein